MPREFQNNPGDKPQKTDREQRIAEQIYEYGKTIIEELNEQFEEQPELSTHIQTLLKDQHKSNKSILIEICEILNLNFIRRNYLLKSATVATGVVMVLRKEFVPEVAKALEAALSDEQELEASFSRDENYAFIEDVVNDLSLRGERREYDYEKMAARLIELAPSHFIGLTASALERLIQKAKRRGRIKDNIVRPDLNKDDLPFLKGALRNPEYYLSSGGINLDKMISELDPDGTRGLKSENLSQFITRNVSCFRLNKDITDKWLNPKDRVRIQKMFDDPAGRYYNEDGTRNYELMIAELDPDGSRVITRSQLALYIHKKKKAGELIEKVVQTNELSFKRDYQIIHSFIVSGGSFKDTSLLDLVDPDGSRGLDLRLIRRFYRRWEEKLARDQDSE